MTNTNKNQPTVTVRGARGNYSNKSVWVRPMGYHRGAEEGRPPALGIQLLELKKYEALYLKRKDHRFPVTAVGNDSNLAAWNKFIFSLVWGTKVWSKVGSQSLWSSGCWPLLAAFPGLWEHSSLYLCLHIVFAYVYPSAGLLIFWEHLALNSSPPEAQDILLSRSLTEES